MKRRPFLFTIAVLVLLSAGACSRDEVYPYRWVYAFGKDLNTDQGKQELLDIVKTCAEHGLNGIALPGRVDQLDLRSPEYLANLREVKAAADSAGIEIIPAIWSIGYGSGLDYDKNLAEGLPVKDALFVVKGGIANVVPDPAVSVPNGSFEQVAENLPAGFEPAAQAEAGKVLFMDTEQAKDGKTSLRVEIGGKFPEESGLLSTTVTVQPWRCYRLSGWIKTEGIESGGDTFPLIVKSRDGRRLQYYIPKIDPTADWTRVDLGFNSLGYDKVVVAVGAPSSESGRFWLDDVRLEEIGLVNVLRREGTPLTVKSDKDGTLYEEGRDYAPVADPGLDFLFSHEGPAIEILPGGRIKDGERLRVGWYHGMTVYYSQVTVCMSDPALYEIWERNAKLMMDILKPDKFMLNMDEIRMGGTCAACEARDLSMPEMLGRTITRQVEIFRAANPKAQVFVWSDMLDPNHNAGVRAGGYMKDYYYHVNESYSGSWNHVPKDLTIVCWYHEVRDKSLAHFSGLGYPTMGGGYYDVDDLENCKDWLISLDATPGAKGLMYCSWSNKFELLGEFGDLMNQPRKRTDGEL